MKRRHTPEEIRAKLVACAFCIPADILLLFAAIEYTIVGTLNVPLISGAVALIVTYLLLPITTSRPLIHSDFGIIEGAWFRNRDGGPNPPDVKVSFAFDDATLLDNCPFPCKITYHEEPARATYFGVAYARSDELSQLKTWTTKFRDQEVRTPEANSQVLEVL